MSTTLQSYIAGQWLGSQPAQSLRSAVNGHAVANTHAEAIDFESALHFARTQGRKNLLALDFQERAQRLKALAKYLMEHKESLYAVSAHTGATRADSWIDIDGGAGTLFAYATLGSNELPSGNVLHEGPAMAAWRCTLTRLTFRFGACSKSSRRVFWRACHVLANPPQPPAT